MPNLNIAHPKILDNRVAVSSMTLLFASVMPITPITNVILNPIQDPRKCPISVLHTPRYWITALRFPA
ncbi:hypothetical protein VcTj87_22840 [Vibrio comitans]